MICSLWRENSKSKSSRQLNNLQQNLNHQLKNLCKRYGTKMTNSTKLMCSSKITFWVKSGSVSISMASNRFKSSTQLIKKMKSEACRWMNTRLDTTSDTKNLTEIRSFNIQERLANRWELCHNRERRKGKKYKKGKKMSKNNSENKQKRKSNNLRVTYWQNFNNSNSKTRITKTVKQWMNKMTASTTGSSATIAARLSNKKKPTTNVNNVKTTCFVRTVLILSFTSIHYISLMFLLGLELLNKA